MEKINEANYTLQCILEDKLYFILESAVKDLDKDFLISNFLNMSNRTIDFNSNSLVLNNFRFKKQDKVLSTGGIVAIILSILVILIILTIFYLYLNIILLLK